MRHARRPAVCGLLAMAWVVAPAAAQPAKSPKTVYTSRTTFSLPVKIDERDRAELRELKFCVKMLQSGGKGEWVCKETAPPSQSKFTFRAPQDGEYWFAFATVDKAGTVAPADLDKHPPGLIVVVDTKPPEIEIGPVHLKSGTFLQCRVHDANADWATVRMECQTTGMSWQTLDPVPNSRGLFNLPSAEALRGVVRASAADLAGNKATREADLSLLQPPPEGVAGQETVATANPRTASKSTTTETPPAPRPSAGEQSEVARLFVNSLRCTLDYALETASGVHVEAFVTRNNGRSWTRAGEGRSPMPLTLPEEGHYGVTLVVSTNDQPAGPPVAGDAPDLWLEVDTTKPEVVVQSIQPGSGPEARAFTFSWSVNDRNLGGAPVEVFAAPSADGPWQPLARGLKNQGTGQCTVPTELGGRVYVRVQAVDKAGNVGKWETRDPIVLEGAKPKARVIGVTAAGR
jgi:hypothetical protein